jgi:hypothetical protein
VGHSSGGRAAPVAAARVMGVGLERRKVIEEGAVRAGRGGGAGARLAWLERGLQRTTGKLPAPKAHAEEGGTARVERSPAAP